MITSKIDLYLNIFELLIDILMLIINSINYDGAMNDAMMIALAKASRQLAPATTR